MSARAMASRSLFLNRRRDGQRIIGNPSGRELLARRAHPHDHRPATMKVDTDILSIHRGLLLFVRGWLCEAPSLDRLGSSRGAEAPLLHRIRSGALCVVPDRHLGMGAAVESPFITGLGALWVVSLGRATRLCVAAGPVPRRPKGDRRPPIARTASR